MVKFKTPKNHWNYFLAIVKDLENISRYIEFSKDNFKTYSIELTHLLLSAASEIDVLMKQICEMLDDECQRDNINDYRIIIQKYAPEFVNEEFTIDRHGISCKPWESWNGNSNPDWWRSYNNVKHQRNNFYSDANLRNTINAVGGLLVTVVYYYNLAFTKETGSKVNFKETTTQLEPQADFMKINADYYYAFLIV